MSEKLKEKIRLYLIEQTNFVSVKETLSEPELREYVLRIIKELSRKERINITSEEEARLISEFMAEFVSLGPIKSLIEDKSISEIMINGHKKIYVERNGHIELTPITFDSEHHLMHTIYKIISASGRHVDESSPFVDFALTDGSRVNIILPPLSMIGPVVTIRKFSSEISTVEDLLRLNTLNQKIADLLIAAIKARLNIIFSGATGVGKTTTLNVLTKYIPASERVVTIEDTAELRLEREHLVSLQSRPPNIEGKGAISIRELFKNSLRMSPDRIIVGEVRGSEALDMIQAIVSGHTGSLAIVHANSPEDALLRLETMILMSGIELSLGNIRRQIAKAIDLIVHMEQFLDGTRKITSITEVKELKEQDIALEDLFVFEQQAIDEQGRVIGKWQAKGIKPLFLEKLKKRNINISEAIFERD
jgi:pilus assembly protein CpaF